jgi:arylsulfatase A-like enzyme
MAVFIVLLVYGATLVEVSSPVASRPKGSVADIATLAQRDDINLLFILVDTLRADRLGAYGYERETSPRMDGMAATGIRFARHLAQSSWTKSSMASLWTGLLPARVGVTRFNHVLPEEAEMPAEILKENGFRTVGIYRNGWVSGYFGFEQGFDVYVKPTGTPLPPHIRRQNPTLSTLGNDIDGVDMALEFLRLHGQDRWFLYIHLMDVHEYLYDEESAVFGTSNADIYDNSVLREDWVVSTLLDYLEASGLADNTVVAITSDHGEALGERDFEGHARAVYPETTEVPFLIGLPFEIEGGLVVDQRSSNVDVWPTLLDLLGLPLPQDIDGQSMLPELLAGASGGNDSVAFAYLDTNWGGAGPPAHSLAVQEGTLRYVAARDKVAGGISEELFDSDIDAGEKIDISEERPEDFRRLQELGKEYMRLEPAWEEPAETLEISEMELNQLRALGYQIP